MHSSKTAIDCEDLLDRALELLLRPTLANLRSVEELLREAIVRMPEQPAAEIGRKVRLCGRMLDSAEAMRPGGAQAILAEYAPPGWAAGGRRPAASWLRLEA